MIFASELKTQEHALGVWFRVTRSSSRQYAVFQVDARDDCNGTPIVSVIRFSKEANSSLQRVVGVEAFLRCLPSKVV